MSKRDYYEVLGVPKNAGDQQKERYRRWPSNIIRSDQGNTAAEEVQGGAELRDLSTATSARSTTGSATRACRRKRARGSIRRLRRLRGYLRRIFGDFRRRTPRRSERGSDLRYDLEITFEESAKAAAAIDIHVSRRRNVQRIGERRGAAPTTCPSARDEDSSGSSRDSLCRAYLFALHGSAHHLETVRHVQGQRTDDETADADGQDSRGIADGQSLRISGEGEGGPQNGRPAILGFIEVAPQRSSARGNNLACEIRELSTLALGGSIACRHSTTRDVQVPEGTQSGTVFRLRGKGMPDVSGRGRGDLFFTAQAITPKKLSKEQRAAFEVLAKALPKEKFEPRARDAEEDEKNIFEKVKDIFG